jgi:NAD+ kinase
MVDFVACLGGDGVILHASNLFRGAVPPVVSFNLGSLGFLTSHYVSLIPHVLLMVFLCSHT